MKTKILVTAGAACVLAVSVAGPALAHHSAAMFDSSKQVTLVGTVKQFQWTNPHSWIQLYVPDATGKPVEWSLEWQGVSGLYKQGVRASSLKPGDKVTIVGSPLRNGNPGANVRSIIGPDGQPIGRAPQG
jgi:hypothetical protein